MPCLIAILLTLFPVLFASGEVVSAVKLGGETTASDVGTSLRDVSPAQGKRVISSLPAAQMLSATYYDAVPAYLGVTCTKSDVLTAPTGLVTAQVDRVLGSSVRSRVYTVNFYDKHERVVFSQQAVADNSIIKTSTSYDFAGNPSSVSTTTYIGDNTFTDTYTYGYDRLNRPTTVSLKHDDKTYPLISNTYDNLGRLRSNGAPGKAAVTFGYDMRSALTSISSNHFIQKINRGDGDSKYRSKSGRITRNDILLTGRHLTFDYLYDGVGRLTKAEAKLHSPEINYTEEFDYDLNTNIIGLRRYGAKNATTGALLDDLTMTYEGNQLRYITDDATDYPYEASLDFRAKAPIESTPGASVAAPFGLIGGFNPIDTTVVKPNPNPGITPVSPTYSADYAYDANGNMTQDRHSSITSIAYNVLNLPQTVTYEGLTINRPVSQIVYDASGKKHIVRNGALRLNKFSGDETRYIGDYIMVNDTIDRLQTPYGYLRDGEFHSYLFDYQGNIVCVMAGNKVVQTNFYYADGLPMNNCTGVTANAFKYTAKELSLFRGLPVYDYTARHTLPQINRFRTMDPLAEKYHGISPYAFCAGDPINFSDPTGMDIYMLFYTIGNNAGDEMFKAAAETRKADIENSAQFDSSKDIVILSAIEDLAKLADQINEIVSQYSETYGKTAEFGLWSHSALDGPRGSLPTSDNKAHANGIYQMSLKGWSEINFNWSQNASASFYGCRSGVINRNDGTNCSFSTKVSGLKNFHNVDVYGQSSYSYPSKEPSFLSRDLDIYLGIPTPPIYMVGREGNNFFGSSILKMRKSRNGKGTNNY